MLLQINYPDLDVEKIKIRADNYTCNCAKFLISPNTAKILSEYIGLKQQRGEHLNLMKLCNVITSHEAGNSADRIQQVVTLLDTSITAASNVEELLVASSSFPKVIFSKDVSHNMVLLADTLIKEVDLLISINKMIRGRKAKVVHINHRVVLDG